MSERCPECGACLPDGGVCRDYFHELLALEAQVPGAPGELPHFLAVAAYNLQHPSQFTHAALQGLRETLADVLAGRGTLQDVRRRARYAANGVTRVLRRPDDGVEAGAPPGWPSAWAMTVVDACRVAPEEYSARVRQWAEAVSETLAGAPCRR